VELLNQHRKAQLQLRLKLGMGKLELESFVFANEDGTPISPNYFSIMWSRSMARAGLPKVTFHSLRHSHALCSDSRWPGRGESESPTWPQQANHHACDLRP
jgi:integrase